MFCLKWVHLGVYELQVGTLGDFCEPHVGQEGGFGGLTWVHLEIVCVSIGGTYVFCKLQLGSIGDFCEPQVIALGGFDEQIVGLTWWVNLEDLVRLKWVQMEIL